MQANRAPLLSSQSSHAPSAGGSPASQESLRPVRLLESADLLRGNKAVGITHNGSLYRLQATKLGKLILTK